MIERGIQLAPLSGMQMFEGCTEAILHRDGRYQVELVAMPPHAVIRRHRHNRASSVDMWLAGDIDGMIGSHQIKSQRGFGGAGGGCLFPIPRGVWHHGVAGPQGLLYVSFQQWDGDPTFISDDWDE